eukprot:5741837-Amphidinium_carterae.1
MQCKGLSTCVRLMVRLCSVKVKVVLPGARAGEKHEMELADCKGTSHVDFTKIATGSGLPSSSVGMLVA